MELSQPTTALIVQRLVADFSERLEDPNLIKGVFRKDLDDKGRVIVPKEWRGILENARWLPSPVRQNSIVVVPTECIKATLTHLVEDSKAGKIAPAEALSVMRDLSSNAIDVSSIDPQGRIVIPKALREHLLGEPNVKGRQEILLFGCGNHIEISLLEK